MFATLGYKSLASYTVDFRQLGTDETMSPAAHGQNSDGWQTEELKGQTQASDYNAAANVDIAVSLPYDRFAAYFIKLRPALAPFVNSITVYKTDGTNVTVYKELEGKNWQNNANMQKFNNTILEDSSAKTANGEDAGWWRINLLDEGTEIKADGGTYKPDLYSSRKFISDSGSTDGYYYESPSVVRESGTIDKVVLNMSVNVKAADGEPQNLWKVIAADEGTWYKEPQNPEKPYSAFPYNANYNTINQQTRHSMEIAGRVIRTGSQKANVSVRMEIGSQFKIDEDNSKDPYQARTQDQVTRIRVQEADLYNKWYKECFSKQKEYDGDKLDKTVLAKAENGEMNRGKSNWSYKNWHFHQEHYHAYRNYHPVTKYSEWHARHLEDETVINGVPSDVLLQKGLGQTGKIQNSDLGKPFAAASGDIRKDSSQTDYGKLRAYGIGINQLAYQTPDDVAGNIYEDPLYAEWKDRITHVDYLSMNDTLPYIGRKDGFYKGFFSRYLEIADSIKPYLMNLEVTISQYTQDKDGNTVGAAPTQTRVVTIPYDKILLNNESTTDGRVLFRYRQSENGQLYGNDALLASASDAELSSEDAANKLNQPGDPLNDEMAKLTGDNVITLEKNEYPSKISVRLVNLPGNGDMTDEYTGVEPKKSNSPNPDWYIMGNVCDVLYNNNTAITPTGTADAKGNYTTSDQPLANYAIGRVGYLQSKQQIPENPEDLTDNTVQDKNLVDNIENYDESYPTSARNANGSHSNFALWYARTIEPRVQIDSETVDLKNNRVGSGRQNDPTKDDTSAPDMVEGNTNTPLKDVYDYGGDNLKPDTLRFRVWATNKTTKELDTLEIPGLDIKGAYYDQLNYSDVLPGRNPDPEDLDPGSVHPKDHQQ